MQTANLSAAVCAVVTPFFMWQVFALRLWSSKSTLNPYPSPGLSHNPNATFWV